MPEEFEIEDGVLRYYNGNEAHVAIPEGVTEIGERAFWRCEALASVSIPEDVTEIGEKAFYGCRSLASVDIPSGMTEIVDSMFYGCSALASVSIPEGVIKIGYGAFLSCRSLASVSIPEGVTEIGERAFEGCKALASVTIPGGVTRIMDWTFYGCEALVTASIPSGVTRIGAFAFMDCDALASISIPESVAKIEYRAFGSPPATVICPEGSYAHRHCEEHHIPFLFDYQYEAFGGLLPQGFEKLASPFSADEEGPFVFVSYSHRDRELVLPVIKELYESGWRIWYDEGLTIGDSYDETLEAHVRGCAAFLLFVTPNSLASPYIGAHEVPWAVSFGKPIVECALEGCERYPIWGGSAAAAVTPSGIGVALERVEGLTKGAPREARGITVVVDPAARSAARTAASGGGYACCLYSEDGAAAAKAIMLEARRAGCALYDAAEEGMDPERIVGCACLVAFLDRAFLEDGLLAGILAEFYRAGKEIAVCALGDVEDVGLPEGLAGLDKEHWLVYAHGIKADLNAQLVRHLQRLGCRDAAVLPGFEYDQTDQGIIITRFVGLDPSPRIEASYGGVPVVGIASGAFEGCTHLREVAIPDGVMRIGDEAFSSCRSLASVSIPESMTEIGYKAFSDCKSLTCISIPEGVTEIGGKAFEDCSALASVSIPESVAEIGDQAFYGCTALASVVIPKGVMLTEYDVIDGCEAPASVSIPEGVTQVGLRAFAGCASLVSVDIPSGVTRIERAAFLECTALSSVSIPESVTEIGKSAFAGCESLVSVSIPDGVTRIGEKAFSGCERLTVKCSHDSYASGYCRRYGIPINLNLPGRDTAMSSSSDDASAMPSPSDDVSARPSTPGFFAKLFGKK